MNWLEYPAFSRIVAATVFACLSGYAAADWSLDNNDSRLSFITTKAGNVAEVHRFSTLSGAVDKSGAAHISIHLASVDTLIDIRNERMKAMLFETDLFPKATIDAQIDLSAIDKMAAGDTVNTTLNATLNLHGKSTPLTLEVVIARLSGKRLMVSSWRPVIINASDYALVEGLEKLRTVAGLPSISNAVPVDFVLMFSEESDI